MHKCKETKKVDFRDRRNFFTFRFDEKLFTPEKLRVCRNPQRTSQQHLSCSTCSDHVITSATIWSLVSHFSIKKNKCCWVSIIITNLKQHPKYSLVLFQQLLMNWHKIDQIRWNYIITWMLFAVNLLVIIHWLLIVLLSTTQEFIKQATSRNIQHNGQCDTIWIRIWSLCICMPSVWMLGFWILKYSLFFIIVCSHVSKWVACVAVHNNNSNVWLSLVPCV